MSLVNGAFQLHNVSTLGNPATNALPGGHTQEVGLESSSDEAGMRAASPSTNAGEILDNTQIVRPMSLFSSPALTDMISLLPNIEAASLLVDTYFDRVHWFMLIFHQDEFRQRWPKLYQLSRRQSRQSSHWTGFVSTLLMVIAIGLQYAGPHRQRLLARHGVSQDLKERILSTVRARLLDIVSLGSLEAVQTCILLGTFYLYHGAPRLAWPVCGCGLRIAQALQLHRKLRPSGTQNLHMQKETRKRCWWAIYEIETFCAVSYGYPHSIRDADCDVEPLDPLAKLPVSQSPSSFDEPLTGEPTLLSYKYFMSKLSVITKQALAELYRIGPDYAENAARVPPSSDLRGIIRKVDDFDSRLRQWDTEIPAKLRWQNVAHNINYTSLEEVDEDIGASGPRFENHIYQLQALALTLAYESSRILIYRPLLSYKLINRPGTESISDDFESAPANPLEASLRSCREAAIKMSEISSSAIVDLVSETYAAGFVSIHTFTAGVALGIITSMDPLNSHSGDTKRGLRQLMGIQEKLKSRSIMAEQGLEILQRLTKLVMEKELSVMLDLSKPGTTSSNTPRADVPSQSVTLNDSSAVANPTMAPRYPNTAPRSIGDPTMPPVETDLADTSTMLNDPPFQYMENFAFSGALDDFDQGRTPM
ncbi:transcription factor domain-containing protein [Aspergillus melleus]|uniref:transcription factor domain-containing protein n=1 Tax=Aspergillus melleus TaxID=138277 RepID=UPI001E8EE273|nr:uncharacterized protein LDX57_006765 [Aspergillus melleus]KAH8429095.1 hypothetical protein LDX57_006765 [Aspergillus melleus]